MNSRTLVTVSSFVAASALGAQKAPDITPYLIADRTAEVALARTAAPSAISENATVLVLTPKGYTEAARGSNSPPGNAHTDRLGAGGSNARRAERTNQESVCGEAVHDAG